MEKTDNETPRRIRLDKMVPAEKAIREAILAVEGMGANIKLTQAVISLQEAQKSVADFVDSQITDAENTRVRLMDNDCGPL